MIAKKSGRTRAEYMSMALLYRKRAKKHPIRSEKRTKLLQQARGFKKAILRIIKKGLVYTCIKGVYRELPKELHKAADITSEYFGTVIRGSRVDKKGPYTLAQRVFCKYAIELGYTSRDVSFILGSLNRQSACLARTKLNRSFKSNPANKKAYHDFLQVAQLRQNEKL